MSKDVCDWTVPDVGNWLQSNNLQQYQDTFLKNVICGDILTEMDDFDLVILEIEDDDKNLILSIIKEAKKSLRIKKKALRVPPMRPKDQDRNPDPIDKLGILERKRSISLIINRNCKSESGCSPRLFSKKRRSKIPIPNIQIDGNEEISAWGEQDVCEFLKKNSLKKRCTKFRKNAIDGEALLDLTVLDFQALGMEIDEAVMLYQALKTYKRR